MCPGKSQGKKRLSELADALESVAHEPDHMHQCVNNDAEIGQFGADAVAEAGSHPFGAGEHVRPPHPGAQIHHAEDDAEQRPNPQQPGGLHAVDEKHHHEPHRAGHVDAAGAVRHADDPPRKAFAGEKIGLRVFRRLLGRPPSDQAHQDQIQNDDREIDRMHDARLVSRRRQMGAVPPAGRTPSPPAAHALPLTRGHVSGKALSRRCFAIHAGHFSRCSTNSCRLHVASAQYLSAPP